MGRKNVTLLSDLHFKFKRRRVKMQRGTLWQRVLAIKTHHWKRACPTRDRLPMLYRGVQHRHDCRPVQFRGRQI